VAKSNGPKPAGAPATPVTGTAAPTPTPTTTPGPAPAWPVLVEGPGYPGELPKFFDEDEIEPADRERADEGDEAPDVEDADEAGDEAYGEDGDFDAASFVVGFRGDAGDAAPLVEEVPEGHRAGFISIVGRPNVGKSTILNALVGEYLAIVSDKPQTTRNRILAVKTTPLSQMVFVDTPGIHRAKGKLNRFMVEEARSALLDANVILFVVEAWTRTNAKKPKALPPGAVGDDSATSTNERIAQDVLRTGVPVIVAINKIDKVNDLKALLPQMAALQETFGAQLAAAIPLCATKGQGLPELEAALSSALPEAPRYFPGDTLTDRAERFFVEEFIREQILLQTREEVPYGAGIKIERFEEKTDKDGDRGLCVIKAIIYVARESQKGILIGHKGQMLKSIGEAARTKIEAFLDARVFLDLTVRVADNWTEDERRLAELGYRAEGGEPVMPRRAGTNSSGANSSRGQGRKGGGRR
jgi:GTPase